MKKIIALVICLPSIVYAQSSEKNFIDQNYIEVTGKSLMKVVPDLIYIKISLSEKDKGSKAPLDEREKVMFSRLKEIGIDVSKDIALKDMSSSFKYYLLVKTDILLSRNYELLVKDGNTAGRVFIELEKLGISNVSIDRLDNTHIEQYRKDAKVEAIKAAKAKAEALSNAIGQNIGRAIFIQEADYNSGREGQANRIVLRGSRSMASDSGSGFMDIDFEKIEIEYAVLCRFELK